MKTKIEVRREAMRLRGVKDKEIVEVYTEALRAEVQKQAVSAAQLVTEGLAQAGAKAVKRVNSLINSQDQQVATKNAHFVINHIIGTPLSKSVSQVTHHSIDSVIID